MFYLALKIYCVLFGLFVTQDAIATIHHVHLPVETRRVAFFVPATDSEPTIQSLDIPVLRSYLQNNLNYKNHYYQQVCESAYPTSRFIRETLPSRLPFALYVPLDAENRIMNGFEATALFNPD